MAGLVLVIEYCGQAELLLGQKSASRIGLGELRVGGSVRCLHLTFSQFHSGLHWACRELQGSSGCRSSLPQRYGE